jgi:hypothetical protein
MYASAFFDEDEDEQIDDSSAMPNDSPSFHINIPPFVSTDKQHDTTVNQGTASATVQNTATDNVDNQGDYTEMDVLCEKGGRANNHMGNRVFLRLVQRNKSHYRQMIIRRDRDMLIQSILQAIQQSGGRFRRFDKDTSQWQTVDMLSAYRKIRQALREPDRTVHKASVVANESSSAKLKEEDVEDKKPAALEKKVEKHVPSKIKGAPLSVKRSDVLGFDPETPEPLPSGEEPGSLQHATWQGQYSRSLKDPPQSSEPFPVNGQGPLVGLPVTPLQRRQSSRQSFSESVEDLLEREDSMELSELMGDAPGNRERPWGSKFRDHLG